MPTLSRLIASNRSLKLSGAMAHRSAVSQSEAPMVLSSGLSSKIPRQGSHAGRRRLCSFSGPLDGTYLETLKHSKYFWLVVVV